MLLDSIFFVEVEMMLNCNKEVDCFTRQFMGHTEIAYWLRNCFGVVGKLFKYYVKRT